MSGDAPTEVEIISALNNGLTPVRVLADGSQTNIERLITTWCQTSNGDPFYEVRDFCKVSVSDRCGDLCKAAIGAGSEGKDRTDDPAEGVIPDPNDYYPALAKADCAGVIRKMSADGLIDRSRVGAIIAGIQAETDGETGIFVRVPLEVKDILVRTSTLVSQVA
jgi:hypothetical protein